MRHGLISFSSAIVLALVGAPVVAWADANPDFDDDAKPILRQQPGLIQYVQSRFQVKETGTAKIPGDDDRRPAPPYIFRARPIGYSGPYNLRLLIQPGPPGHILGVVDMAKVRLTEPGSVPPQSAIAGQPTPSEAPPAPQAPEPSQQQQPASEAPQAPEQPAPAAQAPDQQPSGPTADTPSGPIMGPDQPTSGQPSLAPPPDPAPPAQ